MTAFVASAMASRRNYGESGLRCLECGQPFRNATEFIEHPCWLELRLINERAAQVDHLQGARPAPADFETLRGEQLPLLEEN
jgi:uncharacterized C2H2 Zn-finger protein